MTNEHVVRDPGPARVRLSDGREAFAELLVADREVDLAVLRISLAPLDAARFGDTSKLRAGDSLVVAGFALDLPGEPSISRGVFSGRRLLPDAPIEYLQTDAAMNPGVSGGPMLDLAGEVVGINTWGIERVGGRTVQGVNFAIPAEVAISLVEAGRTAEPPTPAATPRPQTTPPSTSELPSQFCTVCVWCDSGTHDPKGDAEKIAAELRAAGFAAGVLSSSDYATLNAGYWVTFSGIFDGEQQADQQREALARAGFSGRVRWVSTLAAPAAPMAEQPFWTAVVTSTRSRADAEAVATRLRAQGLPAEVLFSSDYGSLNPGYWVAYSGRFAELASGQQQAQRLRGLGYSGAYAREVRR